jgi:hypothetical protein
MVLVTEICDLPRYLSSEDAIWFKRELDTLWQTWIKLVHSGEKCLYIAELKDLEEWENQFM